MRNNNMINNKSLKPNNHKNFPVYCLPFGLGFVSYTHNGFNLNGYKPGYKFKFNFKYNKYENSTLLRLFGYGISRLIKGVLDISGVPKLRPISVPIQRND